MKVYVVRVCIVTVQPRSQIMTLHIMMAHIIIVYIAMAYLATMYIMTVFLIIACIANVQSRS